MVINSCGRREGDWSENPADLVAAAIGELPGAYDIESTRDSLQLRARMKRFNPYLGDSAQWAITSALRTLRNQVLATVTPNGDAGSVTLICEPERGAWTDWFCVDYGTKLENAEALGRAIARRVAERRRTEQADARQSATEKELIVAKLSLLHAQVEPHFLYNTLASAQLVMTAEGEALLRKPIRDLLEVLDPASFKQIHRSTIVNLKAIASIARDDMGRGVVRLKNRPETLAVRQPFMALLRNM